jgi:hypothetical protein
MGAGSSRPTSTGSIPVLKLAPITRERLLKNTESPRLMINDIFMALITKLTPVDILKLADSKQCSAYIFAMAETLDNLFKGLRIQPRQEKGSGVILFQKLDTIKSETKESRSLCLTLAYYYIRIFQIFGALALTVVDDPGSMEVLGAIQRGPAQRPIIPGRGFYPAQQPIPLRGGAITDRDILNITEISTDNDITPYLKKGNFKVYKFDNTNKMYYYSGAGNHNVLKETENYDILAKLKISKSDELFSDELKFTVSNFSLIPKISISESLVKEINKMLNRGSTEPIKLEKKDDKWVLYRKDMSVEEALNRIFNSKIEIIKSKIGSTYKQERRLAGLDAFRPNDYSRLYDDYKRGDIRGYTTDSVGTLGALSTGYIIKTLESFKSTAKSSEGKALSFCTARALQLLDATTIQRPTKTTISAKSGICVPTLAGAPLSVPAPGSRLDSVPGMHSLEQLYHTKVSLDDGKFTVLVPDNERAPDGEYAKFLQDISTLFTNNPSKIPTKFSEITASAPTPQVCAQAAKKYLQVTDPKTINEVMNIINRMFARQLNHTNSVINFMKTYLFNIKSVGVGGVKQAYIDLNPRILQNGINEINQIGKAARQLLLNYYKDCETAYKQGLDSIAKSSAIKVIQ